MTQPDRSAVRRHRMVERQLRRRGIGDGRVLMAMESVPRHEFVPEDLRNAAYEDRPLPIGSGQTISQPYIVARMADLAQIEQSDRVLDVGTGCGYAAAVYAEMGATVTSVEIRADLSTDAARRLERLGYDKVTVLTGDGRAVASSEGPFDAIVVAAAGRAIPSALEEGLSLGGRLVVPVGEPSRQWLWVVAKDETGFSRRRHEAVAFVPLVGE